METQLEKLRRVELSKVKEFFKPGMQVLEIGGGNGYQAHLISSWGCNVVSIDVAARPTWPITYFKVQNYDGISLPFPDNSFDLVFSSNVLEHVPVGNLDTLLKENNRVMRNPGAVAIHILPTPMWRFWNIFAHYAYLCKYILGYGKTAMMPTIPSREDALKQHSLYSLMKRAIVPGPHGEYANALMELYFFGKRRWKKEFKQADLLTEDIINLRIFYTGFGLIPNMSFRHRGHLARYLGASTYAYILRGK